MRWLSFVPLIAAMSVGAALLAAPPRTGQLRYLLTDREGFALGDVEMVAAPPVTMAVWSPDGRALLVVRQEKLSPQPGDPMPSGALSLVAWNRGSGRSRVIWQRLAGAQMITRIEWMPGTHSALMELDSFPSPPSPEPRKTLFWIDAARGVTRALGDLQDEQLLVAPAQPWAVLYSQGQRSLRLVGASGSMGPALPLPKNFTVDRWAPDGSVLYGVVWEGPGTREQPAHPRWHTFDPRTNALTALASVPEMPQEKPMPVHLRSTATSLKEGNTTQRIFPLWLESAAKSEQPRVLVCADSDGGSLAPDASAVLYLSQGAAWAAPLTRLPREQMLAQVRAAQREAAVSNAKQLGLALAMYAQDYDETFPLADGSATNALVPYIHSDDVVSVLGSGSRAFVYSYNGGPMNTIKDPVVTVLGYLPGPGGRAVIFADGHVEWRSN